MKTPTYWLVGFIFNFLIGGITGVALGMIPFDYQVTMSYFVVAHFHNVMMFGTAFLAMARPLLLVAQDDGRFLDEKLGMWHFWLFMVGSWMTFLPQYILGLLGMPRRYYTYPDGNFAWTELNFVSTLGALTLLAGGTCGSGTCTSASSVPSLRPATPGAATRWNGQRPALPPPTTSRTNSPTFPTERPLYDWEKNGDTLTPVDPKTIHLPQDSIWPFVTACRPAADGLRPELRLVHQLHPRRRPAGLLRRRRAGMSSPASSVPELPGVLLRACSSGPEPVNTPCRSSTTT